MEDLKKTQLWKKYRRGDGIRVKLDGDTDKYGKQKYRPGIVIRNYPNFIKVQLLSTNPKNSYYSILLNDTIQYIKPNYNRSVYLSEIHRVWSTTKTRDIIKLKKNHVFFLKVAEMEYKEISGHILKIKKPDN